MKNTKWVNVILIGLPFLIGAIFYSMMPTLMVTHWDSAGMPNGYMGRFWGVFLAPIIIAGVFFSLTFMPRLDPLRENIDKFKKTIRAFYFILYIFLMVVYIYSLLWNMDIKFEITRLMSVGFAVLFYYIGVMLPQTQRNYMIGIKTPWTLASDKVWQKTHSLAGRLFKVVSIVTVFGLLSKKYAIYFIVGPLIAVIIYLILFSCLLYVVEEETNKQNLDNNI